jgi:four helix bundle protein
MSDYNNNLPVIKKIYELYKTFYGYSNLFPKKDKHTLGSKCEMYILSVLELLIAAGSASKSEKIAYIRKANIKFDTLKVFIRLANEINMLDNKKYLVLQKQIQEIGRMIGGWQKSFN